MMKPHALLLAMLALPACKMPQYVQAGTKNDVAVDYRWNVPPDKPAELLLRLKNSGTSAQRIHIGLDLYYQGFTVEELTADTCIPAGRTFNGKLNGIYFIPKRITPEQASSPDTKVALTDFTAVPVGACP